MVTIRGRLTGTFVDGTYEVDAIPVTAREASTGPVAVQADRSFSIDRSHVDKSI